MLPGCDQVAPAGLCSVTSCVLVAGEFRADSNKDLPVCSTNMDLPCTLRLSEDREAEGHWRGERPSGPHGVPEQGGGMGGGCQAQHGGFRAWKWGPGTFVTGHGGLAGCSCPELGVAGQRSDPIHPREAFSEWGPRTCTLVSCVCFWHPGKILTLLVLGEAETPVPGRGATEAENPLKPLRPLLLREPKRLLSELPTLSWPWRGRMPLGGHTQRRRVGGAIPLLSQVTV